MATLQQAVDALSAASAAYNGKIAAINAASAVVQADNAAFKAAADGKYVSRQMLKIDLTAGSYLTYFPVLFTLNYARGITVIEISRPSYGEDQNINTAMLNYAGAGDIRIETNLGMWPSTKDFFNISLYHWGTGTKSLCGGIARAGMGKLMVYLLGGRHYNIRSNDELGITNASVDYAVTSKSYTNPDPSLAYALDYSFNPVVTALANAPVNTV